MHQRRQDDFLLDTQLAFAQFAEFFGKTLVDLPVAFGLPHRIHRSGQRMDEGMHVAGVEVVFLVPGGGWQHDVRVQAGRAHAKVQRDQQVQLAFGGFVMPDNFFGLGLLRAQVFALHAVGGAQQVLEEILMPLARRADDVGAPDKHVARPVGRVVRVFAAELERAVLE